jgi:pyridoxine 5'-phosphate synthase PdxJ
MQYTSNGNVSCLTETRRHLRRHLLIEKIVKLTIAGLDDTQIAFALGITKVYVSMNRRTPEYLAIWAEEKTGVTSRLNADIRSTEEYLREELQEMTPAAMLALREAVSDKSNPRLRIEAAKQILDREGTLVPVSKTSVTTKFELDLTKHDKEIPDLLAALSTIAQSQNSETELPGSQEFKNAELSREMYDQVQSKIDMLEEFDPSPNRKPN